MASSRPVQFVVLCEDIAHAAFVRGYIERRFGSRARHGVRVVLCDRGAGDQFVRLRYPLELRENRRRASSALIVVTDADSRTVEERLSELRLQLETVSMDPPRDDERACVLVPKRNVETWVAYLVEEVAVDEESNYKQPELSRQARKAGGNLAQRVHQPLPSTAPSSLERARLELLRIPAERNR